MEKIKRKNRINCLLTFCLAPCLFLLPGGCSNQHLTDEDAITIFDGKTLNGWQGDPTYWRVENGVLVGEVTPETLLKRNSFLIWEGDMPPDFELKVEFRVSEKGNSGINYRSEKVEGVPFALRGYQADLDGKNNYTGSNYEERRRTTLASQGEIAVTVPVGQTATVSQYVKKNRWTAREVTGTLGTKETLSAGLQPGQWHEYTIVAKGNRLKHFVNGILMSDVTDNDTVNRRNDGLLGVQVHVGPPMKIEYRNFRLTKL